MPDVASFSVGSRRVWRLWCVGLALATAVVATTQATPAQAGNVPNWEFDLRVARWVAPSKFEARVVKQTAGYKVRKALPVTLVLDRRTRCSVAVAGAAATPIPCREIRPRVTAAPGLRVIANGQFETGNLGRIGFRASTVLVKS
jgi:hypothetical protein